MFDGIATSLPQIRAGKLKAYAFTGPTRSAYLPDVPTTTELGLSEINAVGWLGVIARGSLPDDLTQKISVAVRKVATVPAFNEALRSVGLTPDSQLSSVQLRDELSETSARNAAIVRQFGIKLD
jgi:tripartite-type tricarboxylate transporter receptor subunit TctC